jgi:hypothetical protein
VVKFLSNIKNASTACSILKEIGSIRNILSNIKILVGEAESDEIWLATVRSLNVPNGLFAQFQASIRASCNM